MERPELETDPGLYCRDLIDLDYSLNTSRYKFLTFHDVLLADGGVPQTLQHGINSIADRTVEVFVIILVLRGNMIRYIPWSNCGFVVNQQAIPRHLSRSNIISNNIRWQSRFLDETHRVSCVISVNQQLRLISTRELSHTQPSRLQNVVR